MKSPNQIVRKAMAKNCCAVVACAMTLALLVPAGHGQENAGKSGGPTVGGQWLLWSAYKAHFLDASGRVVDHDVQDRTTSEGQAYALFFSLVANDRVQFDALLKWTTDNLAQGDLTAHLPAWEWGRAPDGGWHTLDSNSAADADLWISYTLLQAGRLWAEPRYRSLGLALAAEISEREVKTLPRLGPILLPAANGFDGDDKGKSSMAGQKTNSWILNPSYSPLPVLMGMAHAAPQGPWRAMANALPNFLAKSSVRGLAMDWVRCSATGTLHPAALPGATKDAQPMGSYDAIRVYLWAGLAPRTMPGAQGVLQSVPGMQRYLASHAVPPRLVNAEGEVTAADGGVGFSAAVIPYLSALRAHASLTEQENRMQALLDPSIGLYGSPAHYYDENLALFEEGWQRRLYRFASDGDLQVQWSHSSEHGRAHGSHSSISAPSARSTR